MASRSGGRSGDLLKELQKRLKGDREGSDAKKLIKKLARNVSSQRQLAEWQEALRNEQEYLIGQLEVKIHST